jgi:hypothetical protein
LALSDLVIDGSVIKSWRQLENLGRSLSRFVIKPSGFSELAWRSRGVVVGRYLDVFLDEMNGRDNPTEAPLRSVAGCA